MKITELRHSVQAVISTGSYENQRENFDVLATLQDGDDPEKCMKELEAFNHARLSEAVNKAKCSLIEKLYSTIRFRERNGKKYPSVTSILSWDTDWKISDDELRQYASVCILSKSSIKSQNVVSDRADWITRNSITTKLK
jgi:hypothetical protein